MSTGNRDESSLRHDAVDPPKHAAPDGRAGIRESIWTISRGWRGMYFAFFSLQMVSGMSVIFWYHVFEHVDDSIVETLIGIIQGSASVSVGSAGTSYTLAEGARLLMILANNLEQWINKKWDERDARNRAEGIAIGVEEGEKKGIEIGLEEGRAVERAEWEDRFADLRAREERMLSELRAWNDRRMAAESRGEAFDEPMPGSDNGSVHSEED